MKIFVDAKTAEEKRLFDDGDDLEDDTEEEEDDENDLDCVEFVVSDTD